MFGYEEPAAEAGAGAPLARAAVTDNTALPIAPRMVVWRMETDPNPHGLFLGINAI